MNQRLKRTSNVVLMGFLIMRLYFVITVVLKMSPAIIANTTKEIKTALYAPIILLTSGIADSDPP